MRRTLVTSKVWAEPGPRLGEAQRLGKLVVLLRSSKSARGLAQSKSWRATGRLA